MSSLNEYVTPTEIGKIQKVMGLNDTKFAQACGASSGQLVSRWRTGKIRPSGDRYERLLLLKKKFLNGATPPVKMSEVVSLRPEPKKITDWLRIGRLVDEYRELNKADQAVLLKILGEK